MRLYTFTISHYSEKIRWALDAAGIVYEETPLTPWFHLAFARRRGKTTTVPILEEGGESIQDSTRILLWLEKHHAPLSWLPAEKADRDRAMALEDELDRVGFQVTRLLYSQSLDDARNVVRFWTVDASPLQRSVLRASFPLLRAIFRRRLRVDAVSVARSRERIEATLALIEGRTSAERPYLVGDRFSIADITAASLLAPLACPDEHPAYGSARFRAAAAPLVRAWQDRPAFAWVRRIYREHRRAWPRAAAIRAAFDAD